MASIRFQNYIFCILLFLFGCASKEDVASKETAESSPAATSTATQGMLSATINGAAWQAMPVSSKDNDAAIASVDPKSRLVTIRGTRSSGTQPETIEITVKSLQPGTYALMPDFDHLQTATYSIGADTAQIYFIHEKQSGEVIISQSDGERIAGTFSFDARNTQGKDIRVSNGTFDVTIRQ